ncbi:Uncharacterized protein PPKH_0168 [Pseudomonas putida]|nr:Uncharacterized protein PPKH_0168 [Pseudomonas putida]
MLTQALVVLQTWRQLGMVGKHLKYFCHESLRIKKGPVEGL